MLEVLLKQKELRDAKAELEKLNADATELDKREAELKDDIEAIETEEQRSAVTDAVAELKEKRDKNKEEKDKVEEKIRGIEAEIEELEKKQEEPEAEPEERKESKTMETRTLLNMSMEETRSFLAREDVKELLAQVRSAYKEQRGITGAELTIPEVMLDLLRENIQNYSKLYRHVNARAVGGQAVQPTMGTIPEAVWTQMCGKINELSLTFNAATVGCWKVAGYFELCHAIEEDSDVALAAEIVTALGAAIGLALDKAIIFGLGTRMPEGIYTRLAQTSQPADYDPNERAWADLHTTNIKTINTSDSKGVALFQNILIDAGAAKGKYSRGEKVWVMNEATYTALMAATVSVDAAGRIVTGVADRMPVVGGLIEVLEIVPDNMIIGGYFDLYTLAERAGQRFAQSEHVRFLQDQTVFKGTARYDGAPAIAEAFVIMMLNNGTASTAVAGVTFAPDEANSVQSIRLNTSTASITGTGTVQLFAITSPGTGTVTWTSATTAKATVDQNGVVTGVTAGTSVITATANGLTASCTVTVT